MCNNYSFNEKAQIILVIIIFVAYSIYLLSCVFPYLVEIDFLDYSGSCKNRFCGFKQTR